MSPLGTLPTISDAALPREIRTGGAEDRKAYKAALGFERMLVEQLLDTAGDALAPEGPHKQAVVGAFADGLTSAGGLGLAAAIHASIKERSA